MLACLHLIINQTKSQKLMHGSYLFLARLTWMFVVSFWVLKFLDYQKADPHFCLVTELSHHCQVCCRLLLRPSKFKMCNFPVLKCRLIFFFLFSIGSSSEAPKYEGYIHEVNTRTKFQTNFSPWKYSIPYFTTKTVAIYLACEKAHWCALVTGLFPPPLPYGPQEKLLEGYYLSVSGSLKINHLFL